MATHRPALRDPCAVRAGKERRIGYELIQAYERGEDRRELFREALLNGAFRDAEGDLHRRYVGLDVRLQQDRYGEDLEIPAHLGEPIKTRTLAQSLCDTDHETCLVLLVFDEAFWERAEGKRDFWGITARSARERGVAFQFWNMQRCTDRPAHSTRLTPALNLALSLALALALARALARAFT